MATILLPPDFKDLLKFLNSEQVEYLLVGGYAVGYHGYPRATGDMDIWVRRNADNASRIVAALHSFGFGSNEITPEVFQEENRVIRMGVPPVRIEFLTTVSGIDFDTCWAVREVTLLDGVSVNMIDVANLKINKKASGRLKDLNDLKNIP